MKQIRNYWSKKQLSKMNKAHRNNRITSKVKVSLNLSQITIIKAISLSLQKLQKCRMEMIVRSNLNKLQLALKRVKQSRLSQPNQLLITQMLILSKTKFLMTILAVTVIKSSSSKSTSLKVLQVIKTLAKQWSKFLSKSKLMKLAYAIKIKRTRMLYQVSNRTRLQ